MPEIVATCPRCAAAHVTFDVLAGNHIGREHNWQDWYEVFAVCRHCQLATILRLSENDFRAHEVVENVGLLKLSKALNEWLTVAGHVSLKDFATIPPPEHLPPMIASAFAEGSTCIATGCYNAAGTMFRLCVDVATRGLLPKEDTPGLNSKVRRDLGLRLPWLFSNKILPEALHELSSCIKEDGNDGAHAGTLSEEDARDLLDFTVALLERLYTEPERLRLAKQRRDKRRADAKPKGA
jgi:hypothetical protein